MNKNFDRTAFIVLTWSDPGETNLLIFSTRRIPFLSSAFSSHRLTRGHGSPAVTHFQEIHSTVLTTFWQVLWFTNHASSLTVVTLTGDKTGRRSPSQGLNNETKLNCFFVQGRLQILTKVETSSTTKSWIFPLALSQPFCLIWTSSFPLLDALVQLHLLFFPVPLQATCSSFQHQQYTSPSKDTWML